MTREEIEALPAGRKIDEEVAKLMGWKYRKSMGRWLDPTGKMGYFASPNFSTRIDEAWEVLVKMREMGWFSQHTDLTMDSGESWWAWHFVQHDAPGYESVRSCAETAPLAICRAALIATAK